MRGMDDYHRSEPSHAAALGHICTGTSAEIKDSPIQIQPVTINLNITVIQSDPDQVEGLVDKILSWIGVNNAEQSTKRLSQIKGVEGIPEHELQGVIVRALENG